MSQPVFDEVFDVLHRPQLARFVDANLRADLLDQLVSGPLWFEATVAVTDCRDPADNKIFGVGPRRPGAHHRVQRPGLLVLHPWRRILILRPAEYLAREEPSDR